ncbi:MAG: efflux RND transporter periplasmic adaptor subunit [Cellvibrionaceae bacterium]
MQKNILFVVLVIIALIAGIALKEYSQSSNRSGKGMGRPSMAAPVEIEIVKSIPWSVQTEAVGTAFANESVELTANVSDTVASLHFEDGQQVKQGDILVVLNHGEEDAELQAAKATLEEEQREVRRLKGLLASRSVSQSLLDERQTQAETAKFRLEAIEARLKDRYIRAPFNGVLGLRQVSVGTFISPGKVITTLDDLDTIKLDFSIPAVSIGHLQEGMSIFAKTPAYPEKEFIGKVSTINSRVNAVDRSIKLRAEIKNTDHVLKPGMLMHVVVKSPNKEVIVISESAIVQNKDKHFVFLVVKKDKKQVAQLQEVSIGLRKSGVVEIVSGLETGQTIISRGTNTVRNNGPVNVLAGDAEKSQESE